VGVRKHIKRLNWLLWPALVVVALLAATYIVTAGMLILRQIDPGLAQSPARSYILSILALGVGVALVIGLPRIVFGVRTSRRVLGIARLPTWKDIGLGVGGVVVYGAVAMVVLAIAAALSLIDITQVQSVGNTSVYGVDRLVAFATLVVVVPLAEELLFRGFLYGRLRGARVPFWLSAVVVSVVFGAMHGQWNVGIDVFCLSMVATYLREHTGTIWPGLTMHMIKNLIAFYYTFMM
jgi:membrane protease YdiL (CAAX protease family)